MTACHIVFEGNADARGEGGPYRVKIHLSVPGAQIHAESTSPSGEGRQEARNALHSAYDNARRQLEKLKRLHIRPEIAAP
jgi:ribosome-associated translation inhibitor RaiA